MEAKCFKLSKTGKTMLVGVQKSKYSVGYEFGWASNPDNLKVGDAVLGFEPTGTVQCMSEAGEPVTHEDGSPVLRFVF